MLSFNNLLLELYGHYYLKYISKKSIKYIIHERMTMHMEKIAAKDKKLLRIGPFWKTSIKSTDELFIC